jgi:hypothetical protein
MHPVDTSRCIESISVDVTQMAGPASEMRGADCPPPRGGRRPEGVGGLFHDREPHGSRQPPVKSSSEGSHRPADRSVPPTCRPSESGVGRARPLATALRPCREQPACGPTSFVWGACPAAGGRAAGRSVGLRIKDAFSRTNPGRSGHVARDRGVDQQAHRVVHRQRPARLLIDVRAADPGVTPTIYTRRGDKHLREWAHCTADVGARTR